jgi:TP901 family phage tail tape measure protein
MASEALIVTISEKGALVVKRNVEGIGKGARKAESSVKLLNRALGGLAAVGVATGIGIAIKQMASFSQEMSTVKAITGSLGQEFDALRTKAKDLGTNTRFSATQAAEGMTFLARAGFSANEVLESIEPTLKLAQAGALDLGRAADIASNILTGFRIDTEDAAHVMDVLALAANSANTNVEQLGEAMKYVAPVGAGLGVSLEETTAAVQALGDAGIQASMAGTSLRMVMRLLESPTEKQKAVFRELGLEAKDLQISQVGLTGALQKLSDAGIQTGQSLQAFGRAGTAFDVLVNAVPKVRDFTKANIEADNTANNIAKTMDENLNGALLAVKSAWEGLVLAFGDLGAESGLTKFFFGLADALRALARNLDLAIKLVTQLGIVIAAIKWSQFLAALSAGNLGVLKLAQGVKLLQGAFASLALNPLTVGFVALGAAVSATLIYFDKLNKMQDEIEAVDERIHKYQLKRLQDKVKEIRRQKEQTANLEEYMKRLERENELLAMNIEEREESINLFKAMEIAGRPLTEQEEQRVTALLKTKQAIKESNEFMAQQEKLLSELLKPQQEYAHREQLLTALRDRGRISLEMYNEELARMKAELGQEDVSDPFADQVASLERQLELLKMTNDEREVQRALDSARSSLPEGQDLTGGQEEKIRMLVEQMQAQRLLNDEEQRKQDLLASIVGPQQVYNQTVSDLNALLAEGSISQLQYNEQLEKLGTTLPQVISETQELTDGALSSLWNNASSAIDQFVDTGIFKFKDFARSVISDITKIAAKMLLLQAFRAMGLPVPGFATGGSFMVGGTGGIDQNLVAFNASRGERVDVLTPAQQQAQAQGQQSAVNASVGVTIINVVDPDEIPAIMASEAGQNATLNTISLNGNTVKQAIS